MPIKVMEIRFTAFDFNRKENIKVSDATTSHLRVTNNHIYFENNRDNIYSLSLLTKELKQCTKDSNC